MRLFFAVNFTPEIKQHIRSAIDGLAIANPPWRWVARDNVHVTLKFLGDMEEDRVDALGKCAMAAVGATEVFQIGLGGIGGFPNLKQPRVLFYQLADGADSLTALAATLDGELADGLSIPRERRPFRAHATIARVKDVPPVGVAD